jgi:multiple sugar transport system substrate-binding protein
MRATSPIVGFVDGLAQQQLLSTAMRPLTPIYTRIEEILGEEIHDAMSGRVSDQVALQKAHGRIQRILDVQAQFSTAA